MNLDTQQQYANMAGLQHESAKMGRIQRFAIAGLAGLASLTLAADIASPTPTYAAEAGPQSPDLAETSSQVCRKFAVGSEVNPTTKKRTAILGVQSTAMSGADLVIVQSKRGSDGKWLTIGSAKNVAANQVVTGTEKKIMNMNVGGSGVTEVRTLAKTGNTWSAADSCKYSWGG